MVEKTIQIANCQFLTRLHLERKKYYNIELVVIGAIAHRLDYGQIALLSLLTKQVHDKNKSFCNTVILLIE